MVAVPTFFHTWLQFNNAVDFLQTLQFLVSSTLHIITTSNAVSHIQCIQKVMVLPNLDCGCVQLFTLPHLPVPCLLVAISMKHGT